MPGKSSTFSNDLLKLIFNGTAIANLSDNAVSSPLTNLWVSLHTADPSAGDASTNETNYGGYARQSVARTSSGWTITSTSVAPVAAISFPQATSGTATLTHFSITTASSGTSKILYSGAISPQIGVAVGVTPRLTTSSTITES